MESRKNNAKYDENAVKPKPKRKYSKPQLVLHGTVQKLTRIKVAGAHDSSMT